MNQKTLIIYSSIDGQTLKICNRLKDRLALDKQIVDLISINDFNKNVCDYEKVVVGSSIRYGVHNKAIIDFLNKNKEELDAVKSIFFSVNLVARKPEKSSPDTNPYVIKFFKTIDWRPKMVEVFAGKLDYKKYSFFDKTMIQLIMWMTKGPTDSNTAIEYTNWEKVKAFSDRVAAM